MKKITLFIFLLTAFFGYAQEKKIERATKRFNQYDYVNSQEIYQKVVDKGYESGDLFKRLADSEISEHREQSFPNEINSNRTIFFSLTAFFTKSFKFVKIIEIIKKLGPKAFIRLNH